MRNWLVRSKENSKEWGIADTGTCPRVEIERPRKRKMAELINKSKL